MINELKLSGNELNLYALIFGFSKDNNCYHGAMKYLADSIGATKQSTLKLLKKLVEKNYILKFESGAKGHKNCDYKINPETIKNISGKESLPQEENLAVKKVDPSGKECLPGGKECLPPSGKESCHHNNIDIINKQKDIYNNVNSQKQAFELSQLLLTSHRKEFPDYLSGKDEKEIKKIIESWARDIELLIRKDKKEPEKIRQVILWVKDINNVSASGFSWFQHIKSGKKLREKFERLYGQMTTEKRSPQITSTTRHRITSDNVPPEDVNKYFREAT